MKTNDATRAHEKALPEINRRRFLLNTAVAGTAVAVAAPAAAVEPEISPMERVENACAELIAAAKVAFPEVDDWRTILPDDNGSDGIPFMFMIIGHNHEARRRRKGGAI